MPPASLHWPISQTDVADARAAARCVVETHHRLAEWLRVGTTLPAIDQFVAACLDRLTCRSAFLGYRVHRSPAFPSHACLSVNDCVVHGTAGSLSRPLISGDVLKVDVGVIHRGWVGDAAWTYVFGPGPIDPVTRRLMDCGKEALRRGVRQLRPDLTYLAWARAVQEHVEHECHFHLIRGLGGHGYGRKLHQPPFVANIVPAYPGEWPEGALPCRPGTLLAVEPMIAVGTGQTRQVGREWPIYTADGSLSVHYEHDVLVTDGDPEVLTSGLEQLPDVVGA